MNFAKVQFRATGLRFNGVKTKVKVVPISAIDGFNPQHENDFKKTDVYKVQPSPTSQMRLNATVLAVRSKN